MPLIFGRLTAGDYEYSIALGPVWGKRIDGLRDRMKAILDVSLDQAKLEAMPVNEYVDLYVI